MEQVNQQSTSQPAANLPKFRPCTCEGTLPGRACQQCFSTKWLKRCPHCFGSGIIYKNSRAGEPRSEPCPNCRRGWQAAMPADLREMRAAAPVEAKPVAPSPRAAKKRRRAKPRQSAAAIVAAPPVEMPPMEEIPSMEPFPVEPGDPDSGYQDMN